MINDSEDYLLSDDIDYGLEEIELFDDLGEIEEELTANYVEKDSSLVSTTQTVKGKKYYLPPEILLAEWQKSMALGEPTPKLIQYFFKIARNVSVFLKLKSQLDIDSCVNYAVSIAWEKKWHKYDENRSENIFSCFTTILLNDMRTHKNNIFKNSYKNISTDYIE